MPFSPAALTYICVHNVLFIVSADASWHSGQPGWIPVLLVDHHAILITDVIQVIHSFPVFRIIRCIDPDDCMQTLSSGMHQDCDRQLQLTDQCVLTFNLHIIRLHKCIPELRHVFILHAIAIQRIEPDPGSAILIVITYHTADIITILGQLFDDLAGRLRIYPFVLRDILSLLVLP